MMSPSRAIMDESKCYQCGGTRSTINVQGLCPSCLAIRGLATNTQLRAGRKELQWQPPAAEQIAASFPELDRLELIGRGGMGAVYRARQKHLDRVVALKILPPQLMRDGGFAQRFAREAQALARLNHPHIVTIHDFGVRGELFFFVMEYVDGVTLRSLIGRGRMSATEAMSVVEQICEALAYAHDHGIVHRDIKPENVLLNKRGQVKIADFGLAKLIGIEGEGKVPIAATHSIVGTPMYMAPEQVESPQDVNHRADIYSLGVVVYELLTGELPPSDMAAPSGLRLEAKLEKVVMRALHPEAGDRFNTVGEFRTALQEMSIVDGTVLVKTQPAVSSGQWPRARRSDIHRQLGKDVRASIATPSRGIKYTAIANIVFLFVTTVPALVSFVVAAPEKVIDSPLGLHVTLPWWATGTFMFTVLSFAMNAFVVAAANRMRELRSYGWSMAGAIVILFAAPANVVGAVFGVWAIVILWRQDTRQAFGVEAIIEKILSNNDGVPGALAWVPVVRILRDRRRLNLVNYTMFVAGVWLASYSAVSLILLGRPAEWGLGLLLVVPSLAAGQSILRRHRHTSTELLQRGNELARRPGRVAVRLLAFASMLLLESAVDQSLKVKLLAEKRAASAATTQSAIAPQPAMNGPWRPDANPPKKETVAERLHIMVPKWRWN